MFLSFLQKKNSSKTRVFLLPQTGIEPVREYKSRRILSPVRLPVPPLRQNGWRWIRTTESVANRFTVCPLWPLGNPSIRQIVQSDLNTYIILLFRLQSFFNFYTARPLLHIFPFLEIYFHLSQDIPLAL